MPKHNTYEQDENISDNDIVLGSDAEDNLKTKNFRIGKLKDYFISFIEGGGSAGPQGPADHRRRCPSDRRRSFRPAAEAGLRQKSARPPVSRC